MSTKRKGSRNEHRTMRLLESLGYACTRAAASLGAWDVIGVCSTDVVLVQVKSNRNPGSIEMEGLRLFRVPPNVRKLLHVWIDRKREPRVTEL